MKFLVFIFFVYLFIKFGRFISRFFKTVPPKPQPEPKQEKSYKDSDIIDAEYTDITEKNKS